MKKIIYFIAASCMLCLTASCGLLNKQQGTTSKSGSTLGIEEEKSPAQLYAEDLGKTTLRGYGQINALPNMQGLMHATNMARLDLANTIEVFVQTAISNYAQQYANSNLSDNQLQQIMEGFRKDGINAKSVSELLMSGSIPVVRNSYIQPNGTITYHVCVELDPSRVAEALAADKQFQEVISKEAQMYIDFKSEEFDKSMEASREAMRSAKMAQ